MCLKIQEFDVQGTANLCRSLVTSVPTEGAVSGTGCVATLRPVQKFSAQGPSNKVWPPAKRSTEGVVATPGARSLWSSRTDGPLPQGLANELRERILVVFSGCVSISTIEVDACARLHDPSQQHPSNAGWCCRRVMHRGLPLPLVAWSFCTRTILRPQGVSNMERVSSTSHASDKLFIVAARERHAASTSEVQPQNVVNLK